MEASHLPFLLDTERGENGTLIAHVAKGNRQHHHLGSATALVIFQGPHAYISPSWYETELAVPTWNYVAVHAYGIPTVFDQPAKVQSYLERLVATYESDLPEPWAVSSLPAEFVQKLMTAIVAFEIPISRIEGKFKLNQNRSAADRQGVVDALTQTGDPLNLQVAALMAESLDA
jgi:transcriptional regulator